MSLILKSRSVPAYNVATMSEPTPQEIHGDIAAGLDCLHLDVDGDGRHFQATIVSAAFDGLSRVQRHQKVYAVLGDKMRERIHALSMKTLTPTEWQSNRPQAGVAAAPSESTSAPHAQPGHHHHH
jgi:acid stress-induced BolA-like protein IbaG/YrbA